MTREELEARMKSDGEDRACIQCEYLKEIRQILRWLDEHGEPMSGLARNLLDNPRRYSGVYNRGIHWNDDYGYGIGYTLYKIPYAEVAHLFKPEKIKPPTKKEFDKAFAAFFA